MGFFLRKTWVWWLLAVALACFVSWLICRWRNRRGEAAEVAALRQQAAEAQTAAAERQARIDGLLAQRARDLDELGSLRAAAAGAAAGGTALGLLGGPAEDAAPAAPVLTDEQLAAGGALLGIKLKLDDLKVVEGVGPAIEELLHGGGIRTWTELAGADVGALRGILEAAGPRFRVHDPATWPRQAGLLASGAWQEFKDLCDQLTAGREG